MKHLVGPENETEPYVATHILKRMRGGSGSLLVWGANSTTWVVKFTSNPQHKRLALTEYLVSYVARSIGLTVPESAIIDIPEQVLDQFLSTRPILSGAGAYYTPGLHYGSRFAGRGTLPGMVLDTLPLQPDRLKQVVNIKEACGALALDAWLNNQDMRQAVYVRQGRSSSLRAFWIDHGHCFAAGEWSLETPTFGSTHTFDSYLDVAGWSDFEPWLSSLETFPLDSLWNMYYATPIHWRCGEEAAFAALLATLHQRQQRLRFLILDVLDKRRKMFPRWTDHVNPFETTPPGELVKFLLPLQNEHLAFSAATA